MNTIHARTSNHDSRGAAIAGFGLGSMAVAIAALVALVAFGGAGRNGNDGRNVGIVPPVAPSPSGPAASPATPRPSAPAMPTATPTARPTDGEVAAPVRVHLETANRAVVTVDVVDETSTIVEARSSRPADGVSVDFDTVVVENLDPSTLQLTWSDYPIDNALTLFASKDAGHLRLVLVRPERSGTTDAIAMDRQLVLRFAGPVDAADVVTFVQDGLESAS